MELYIRIINGQPFEHPIFGDNFKEAFPNVDVNNLPSEFARFERIEKPNTCGTFEIEECSYQWVDGVVKDVWTARAMTTEEIVIKQSEIDAETAASEAIRRERNAIFSQMSGSAPNVIG